MVPGREDARKHPVQLVHPVPSPAHSTPSTAVGHECLAGAFLPGLSMSIVEPDVHLNGRPRARRVALRTSPVPGPRC